MSWQTQTYQTLSNGRPHRRGDLFDAVSAQIPLHHATRYVVRSTGTEKLLPNFKARWLFFNYALTQMGIETDGSIRHKWSDQVRLRAVAGRSCGKCDGPVVKAGWSARVGVRCLACEAKPQPAPVPVPPPALPSPPVRPRLVNPAFVDNPLSPVVTVPQMSTKTPPQDVRELVRWLKSQYRLNLSINQIIRLLYQGPFHIIRRVARAPPLFPPIEAMVPEGRKQQEMR